jgi:ABC-type Zn uptake system ZnuABC Zn-binding protein ZnuA
MLLRLILSLCLGAALIAAGCGGDSDSDATVQVTASTTVAADLARNVAGDRAEVTGILSPSADPHDYEPRPSDAEAVTGADLIVGSGGDLDLWLDEVVESSGSDAPVVTLIDSVQTLPGEAEENDPHWWQNPLNAIAAVKEIRDRLIEADPDGRDTYERNASRYIASLEDLDSQIEDCMSEIPAAERKLVTSHDALNYYADRYGIEVIGAVIPALTTQAQPSAGETAELVELVSEEGVNAIFAEAGVSTDLEQTIAEETGATVGGELWADALGPEGSTGATYLEAMAANTEALADGFRGASGTCEIAPD